MKISTGRTPRGKAPSKSKPDPRQAELPNVQSAQDAGSEPGAPPKPPTLKITEVLAELEAAAKPLNVRVTYEAIGGELGAGGLCKVKGLWRVIIDKRTTPSERVSVLAPSLARFDFASVPMSQQVRELLLRVAPAPVTPPADAAPELPTNPASAATADSATADSAAEAAADPASDSSTDSADEDAAASGSAPAADGSARATGGLVGSAAAGTL